MELVKTSKLPREQNRYLLTGRGGQEQMDFGYIRANGRERCRHIELTDNNGILAGRN
jgi:hypothetical protein